MTHQPAHPQTRSDTTVAKVEDPADSASALADERTPLPAADVRRLHDVLRQVAYTQKAVRNALMLYELALTEIDQATALCRSTLAAIDQLRDRLHHRR